MSLTRSFSLLLAGALVASGSGLVSEADAARASVAGSHSAHRVKRMDFHRISRGDFTSLIGSWIESAQGAYGSGGRGLEPGGTDRISVSSHRIVAGSSVLHGTTFSDGQGLKNAGLVFRTSHRVLTAYLKNENVAINYTVEFYPAGVPLRERASRNVTIPRTRNRIVVWSSNNGYVQVFSQK